MLKCVQESGGTICPFLEVIPLRLASVPGWEGLSAPAKNGPMLPLHPCVRFNDQKSDRLGFHPCSPWPPSDSEPHEALLESTNSWSCRQAHLRFIFPLQHVSASDSQALSKTH